MQALIAEFDARSNEKIESIWREVGMSCGKNSQISFQYPHFTWQAAASYNVTGFEMALRDAFLSQSPFTIKLAGLGVFTGGLPILYLNMVKSPLVQNLHQMITDISKSYVKGLEDYWLPEQWMPHLTLMEPGTNSKTIANFLPCLLERKFDWEIGVKSICLHSDESGKWERLFTIDLL